MPRHHRRKTTRWINEDCMKAAVADICNGIETPSTAARKYGLKRTTIIYRVERKQKMELARGANPEVKLTTQPLLAEIFTAKQEKELMEFLNRYTYLPYDTSSSYQAARQLVYQFVKSHDIKHPKMWDVEQQAGVDWLKGFIQRNPQTNLRKPATWSPKTHDEDEESLSDSGDIKLPFVTKTDKTDIDAAPLGEAICKKIPLSEPSLESDISRACSLSHFMDSTPLRPQPKPSSFEDAEDGSELDIEPECDIMFPLVSIKQESETNREDLRTRDDTAPECKPEILKLDITPVDDDVFNSFGRNIAFQVRELHRLSRLDAYELMHEVQSTVNRRLTNRLRLTRRKENSIRTSEMLLPRVIQIDDDE